MSWEWDLGRLLLAFVVGGVLSHAGSLIQLTTRNEMASPSTLGMDGGAVAIVLLLYLFQRLGLVPDSALCALAVVGMVGALLWFAPASWLPLRTGRGHDFRFVLLLGLSINLMVGALFAVMQFLAMAFNQEFPDQLWFGRVSNATTTNLVVAGIVALVLITMAARYRRYWKAMLLGPGFCHGFQIPIHRMVKNAFWVAFMANLWVVTHFGAFSFLSLLFPLLLRQLSRYHGHPWREMTEGAIVCGVVFAVMDHLCYNVTFHGAEIPVGLPASLAGAGALVVLMWRRYLSAPSGLPSKDE